MDKLGDKLNEVAIDFEHTILDVSNEVKSAVDSAVHKFMDKKDLEAQANGNWSTAGNKLLYKGSPMVLHGFSTTCTEYLLRGIGMKCWAAYNWNDPSNIITKLDDDVVNAVKGYFE